MESAFNSLLIAYENKITESEQLKADIKHYSIENEKLKKDNVRLKIKINELIDKYEENKSTNKKVTDTFNLLEEIIFQIISRLE